MEKIIIVAMTDERVIGKDNDIPWHYSEDMKHFKQKTMDNPVIMGSNTYRSLPEDYKPLPGRTNIVLTREEMDIDESVVQANSLDEAFEEAEKQSEKAFIMGGASVYSQTIDIADRLIITEIHGDYDGDCHFPEIDEGSWKEVERDDREDLSFVEYERTTS